MNNIKARYIGAFTLIELLVVISIIGVLSSVTLASVTQAREKAQNSARVQALRQINLAIQMYELDNGHVPLLGSGEPCGTFSTVTQPTGCKAIQTATLGTNEYNNWLKLQDELSKYIPKLPVDPCGMNCAGITGYTYEAPAQVYYDCYSLGSSCNYSKISKSDYTLYVILKGQTIPTGYSTIGRFFNSPPTNPPYSY